MPNTLPRPEYPRPQFRRENSWLNLNGTWEFDTDPAVVGREKGYFSVAAHLSRRITVPFCMEAPASGIHFKDPVKAVWYRREVDIPENWSGRRILLHVGGADYQTTVWVDGVEAGQHIGGACSWTLDITRFVVQNTRHVITMEILDDLTSGKQACGKQSDRYSSYGCLFSRVTGIWGTVWLEAVAPAALENVQMTTDIMDGVLTIRPAFYQQVRGNRLTAVLLKNGTAIDTASCGASNSSCLQLRDSEATLWSPENPFLYDVQFMVTDASGTVIDTVESYVGFRDFHIEGNEFFFNGKRLFLRFVLDQGYYPEGVWTAPTDNAQIRDIRLALDSGFNGARLHQKVFEERFLYWADKLGYLVCGEWPDWRMNYLDSEACRRFASEFRETIIRDRNHPALLYWVPFNETINFAPVKNEANSVFKRLGQYDGQPNTHAFRQFVSSIKALSDALDPTRPFHGSSGGWHAATDIWSRHYYAADINEFQKQMSPVDAVPVESQDVPYTGQPYIVDEFGMIFPKRDNLQDILKQVQLMAEDSRVSGWCFTQLYDVEQEQNGLFTYQREPKFTPEQLRSVFSIGKY